MMDWIDQRVPTKLDLTQINRRGASLAYASQELTKEAALTDSHYIDVSHA